jgi:hypothetical protein
MEEPPCLRWPQKLWNIVLEFDGRVPAKWLSKAILFKNLEELRRLTDQFEPSLLAEGNVLDDLFLTNNHEVLDLCEKWIQKFGCMRFNCRIDDRNELENLVALVDHAEWGRSWTIQHFFRPLFCDKTVMDLENIMAIHYL